MLAYLTLQLESLGICRRSSRFVSDTNYSGIVGLINSTGVANIHVCVVIGEQAANYANVLKRLGKNTSGRELLIAGS